jgi:hypothetical protein
MNQQAKSTQRAKPRRGGPKPGRAQPWNRPAPSRGSHTHLSPAKKRAVKAKARRAGRPYPNLVDNMSAAGQPSRRSRPSR